MGSPGLGTRHWHRHGWICFSGGPWLLPNSPEEDSAALGLLPSQFGGLPREQAAEHAVHPLVQGFLLPLGFSAQRSPCPYHVSWLLGLLFQNAFEVAFPRGFSRHRYVCKQRFQPEGWHWPGSWPVSDVVAKASSGDRWSSDARECPGLPRAVPARSALSHMPVRLCSLPAGQSPWLLALPQRAVQVSGAGLASL